MKNPAALAILALVAASLALPGMSASEPGSDAVRSMHREISWTTNDATYPGLYVVQIAPSGATFRVICLCPGENRAILTEGTEPTRGVLRTVLLDDRTGWWVRLERDTGVRADSLERFFALALETTNESFTSTLTTSTGLTYSTEVRSADGGVLPDVLLPRMAEAGIASQLAAEIPHEFRAAILFLDRSLMDAISTTEPGPVNRRRGLEGLLSLVARSLFVDEQTAEELPPVFQAPMTIGKIHKGLDVGDEELRSLLRSFTTVSKADLLSDPSAVAAKPTSSGRN